MTITKIKLTKSRTVGMLDQHGRTKFKKVQLGAEMDITATDNPDTAYDSLSEYIEKCLAKE